MVNYDIRKRWVLTGYPDGTYRPEQAMDRDEYAAVKGIVLSLR
ncbi:MAG: S-layer homology domain-containing protein [Leptolyngbyaceae cyanobacterium]